ncbi:MAG: hypothetical protein P857_753 [Candidatus Xenolissoclinum pacificiensis L6]|uniref:Uncharacterized protein n=1 Tax=Candidatus Xenolissoclinum pacificiensis L6 TaxID=1401685 RepID=W2UZ84_9RICK|nr:MAG: hypothetical protein P857_753 [Candidatus Xenolissoclinum pacificiensis L6]
MGPLALYVFLKASSVYIAEMILPGTKVSISESSDDKKSQCDDNIQYDQQKIKSTLPKSIEGIKGCDAQSLDDIKGMIRKNVNSDTRSSYSSKKNLFCKKKSKNGKTLVTVFAECVDYQYSAFDVTSGRNLLKYAFQNSVKNEMITSFCTVLQNYPVKTNRKTGREEHMLNCIWILCLKIKGSLVGCTNIITILKD